MLTLVTSKFLAMCNNTLYSVHYQKCIANKQPTTQLSQYSSLISHDIYYYWFQNGLKALLKSLFDFCTPSPLHIEGAFKKFWGFEATFSDIELRKSMSKFYFILYFAFPNLLNTSYLTDSYIGFTLKIESVSKNTIFGLKMMVKSGLEKFILKSLHVGR